MTPQRTHATWIVEDNDAFRRQLVSLLNLSKTFVVEEVFGAAEPALARMEELSPPEIILMDIGIVIDLIRTATRRTRFAAI